MRFRLLKKDIKSGKAGSSCFCPVALAMERVLGAPVEVWRHTLWFKGIIYELPYKVMEFIKRFDNGLPVKPFSFTIRACGKEGLRCGFE